MRHGFLRQLPFSTQRRSLGHPELGAGACEGMGLLDQYNCEIDQLKTKLKQMENQPTGAPPYRPPANPNPVPPNRYQECPPGSTRSQSPPYDCLPDVITSSPFTYKPGTRPVKPGFTEEGPFAPISVATGGGTPLPPGPPQETTWPRPATLEDCPPGTTRNLAPPYDCRPDIPSPPDRPPANPTPGTPQSYLVPPERPDYTMTPSSGGWGGPAWGGGLFNGGASSVQASSSLTGRKPAFLGQVSVAQRRQ